MSVILRHYSRKLFERYRRINRFFDGKRTDDEIMYLAEINRKQLREVLQQYDDFVSLCSRFLSAATDTWDSC